MFINITKTQRYGRVIRRGNLSLHLTFVTIENKNYSVTWS